MRKFFIYLFIHLFIFLLSYNYILKFFTPELPLIFLLLLLLLLLIILLLLLLFLFFLHKKHNFNSTKKIYSHIFMFYLATGCLINYLYNKMCNFKFISYCKGIALFQSHLCNSIVIVRNKLC